MAAQNSTQKLFVGTIIFIGIVAGYLIYSSLIKPNEAIIPPPAITSKDSLGSFQHLTIDFGSIASATKELKISGESPVKPGVTGKKDLFAPAQ